MESGNHVELLYLWFEEWLSELCYVKSLYEKVCFQLNPFVSTIESYADYVNAFSE